jgi:hypothetical protein
MVLCQSSQRFWSCLWCLCDSACRGSGFRLGRGPDRFGRVSSGRLGGFAFGGRDLCGWAGQGWIWAGPGGFRAGMAGFRAGPGRAGFGPGWAGFRTGRVRSRPFWAESGMFGSGTFGAGRACSWRVGHVRGGHVRGGSGTFGSGSSAGVFGRTAHMFGSRAGAGSVAARGFRASGRGSGGQDQIEQAGHVRAGGSGRACWADSVAVPERRGGLVAGGASGRLVVRALAGVGRCSVEADLVVQGAVAQHQDVLRVVLV